MITERRAGVLLHPTSLPGPGSLGVLGRHAFRFVDLILDAGFRYWQILPLGPVDASLSPYQLRSAHAANPNLIDLDTLVEHGWLGPAEATAGLESMDARRQALARAHARFRRQATDADRDRLRGFVDANHAWLPDYALFEAVLRARGGEPWWEWPAALRDLEADALRAARRDHAAATADVVFEQFVFEQQWRAIKAYANERGIAILGDLPFYIDHNSVDIWRSPHLWQLDSDRLPVSVSGVPPDYFSEDGQLWGHPLYDWERMGAASFDWWSRRLEQQLNRFDLIRLDHFRAFESHWAVPAAAQTARDGRWEPTPGDALFATVADRLGALPFVAEDLGTITPEVYALRDRWRLPGLLVLQFAFDGSADNPYLPENHVENAIVYTGTHDNDTTLGWFESLEPATRESVMRALASDEPMPLALIHEAYRSTARLAVLPMQDLLGLGAEARMNRPGDVSGHWNWRFDWTQIDAGFAARWRDLARAHGRLPGQSKDS